MTRKDIISGLQMTMDLFLLDPATGEILTPDMLNDTNRVTYDACKGAIEALKEKDYASERYADLCEYFDGCSDKGADILHDRNEFKAWLERGRWHVEECDRLSKELEALKAQNATDTNVGSKYEYHYDHTDCIWYRPEARNRCPTTCAQYRDGWNDAMNYIFRDGKGYRPYRRDKQYGE